MIGTIVPTGTEPLARFLGATIREEFQITHHLDGRSITQSNVVAAFQNSAAHRAFLALIRGAAEPTLTDAVERFREAWTAGDNDAVQAAKTVLLTCAGLCQ